MPPLALKSFYSASFFCGRQLCLWWCLASHKPPFMSILPVGDKSGLSSFWRRCVHQIFPFHVFTAVFPADVECPALSLISFCSLVDVSLSALVRRPLLIYNTEILHSLKSNEIHQQCSIMCPCNTQRWIFTCWKKIRTAHSSNRPLLSFLSNH